MEDASLYIFVIAIETENTDIEHLRELLSRGETIRTKAFIRNPRTFVVHVEHDISEVLRAAGFTFTVEQFPIGEVFSI